MSYEIFARHLVTKGVPARRPYSLIHILRMNKCWAHTGLDVDHTP